MKKIASLLSVVEASTLVEEDDIKFVSYTVKLGDSIERISDKNRILAWQLLQANGFSRGVIIHPGQKMKIPLINWSKSSYEGLASWYGPGFHGKPMANTKVYDRNDILVAHRTLPLGVKIRVTNLNNGKSVVAPVLDRGPYAKSGGKYTREIDLSYGAAKKLGAIKHGVIPVKIDILG